MKKMTAYAAMCATALSPIASTAAFAVATQTPVASGPNSTTAASMANTCTSAADGKGSSFAGSVNLASITPTQVGSPTEVLPLARAIDQSSVVPTGTFVPAAPYISGAPFRNGGSVNLFGNQRTTAAYYPSSTYNYTAQFNTTFSYAFSCDFDETVPHHDLVTPGSPGTGHHVRGDGNIHAQNCENFDTPEYFGIDGPGENGAQCVWQFDTLPTDPVYSDYVTHNYTTEPQVAIIEVQPDTLTGYEAHGGPVTVTGDIFLGQVVVCISPGPKGGAWRAQNGYGGGSLVGPSAGCNTPYFKVAPYGNGSQTSNGTYTSVPGY